MYQQRMRPLQQSEMTKSLMAKVKKEKEGTHGDAVKSAFAFPGAIQEPDDNLGQLLTVLGSRDEAVPGATNILVPAQGAGGEAVEDEGQDIIYEDVYFVALVGGLLLHLD
jgi:hypothetical protein